MQFRSMHAFRYMLISPFESLFDYLKDDTRGRICQDCSDEKAHPALL